MRSLYLQTNFFLQIISRNKTFSFEFQIENKFFSHFRANKASEEFFVYYCVILACEQKKIQFHGSGFSLFSRLICYLCYRIRCSFNFTLDACQEKHNNITFFIHIHIVMDMTSVCVYKIETHAAAY